MVPSRPRVVFSARSRPRLPSRRAAPRSPRRASRLVARPAAGSPGAPLGGDDAPIVRLALDLDAPQRAWLASLDEFRVLVLGKTGVGKSSAINALASADATVGELDVGTTQVGVHECELAFAAGDDDASSPTRVPAAVFDTPGFYDVEGRTPAGVLRELSANVDDYHAVVYAHAANDRRLRLEDERSVTFLASAVPGVVRRVVLGLTFANEAPEAVARRAEQARGLFAAAPGVRATDASAIPSVAVGEATEGNPRSEARDDAPKTKTSDLSDFRKSRWEDELWAALVRRAHDAASREGGADAAPLDVDWEALRLAGLDSGSAKPKPPKPPMALVDAFCAATRGEFVSAMTTSESSDPSDDADATRDASSAARSLLSTFAVRQRGMPPGFAAEISLEIRGDLAAPSSTRVWMLMPGAAAGTVMATPMGACDLDALPPPGALRAGGAEISVGGLPTGAGGGDEGPGGVTAGPVTFTFDPRDGSFESSAARVSAEGRVVEIDPATGDVTVFVRKK